MVKLYQLPVTQSSTLLNLPAEVRNQIWRLLFADAEIVYVACIYDDYLSTERYQIVHSCRLAYLDAFALLWSHTKIVYIDCIPAPTTYGLKEQFSASAPCRKLISRMDLILNSTSSYDPCDFRGLRYFASLKEVSIGPMPLSASYPNAIGACGLTYNNADSAGADRVLLKAIVGGLSSSDHSISFLGGKNIRHFVLRRNRKYNVFLRFLVLFSDGLSSTRPCKCLDVTIDWDNKNGKKIVRNEDC